LNTFIEVPATKQSFAQRKLVYGFGINDAKYFTQRKINGSRLMCPYYQKWVAMIERCYSERLHKTRPTYIGCSVCDEWKVFSNFKTWMSSKDWQGMDLDKDLLSPGNKIYSPEFCILIPASINTLLIDCGSNKGDYPTGVSFHKSSGKYGAYCRTEGDQNWLGLFKTPELASLAYREFKSDYIISIAERYKSNHQIYRALINASEL